MPLCDRCQAAEVAIPVFQSATDERPLALCTGCAGKALAQVDDDWQERIKTLEQDSYRLGNQITDLLAQQARVRLEIERLRASRQAFSTTLAVAPIKP
jgi:hypothetical protein